jgi:hypothetical protein
MLLDIYLLSIFVMVALAFFAPRFDVHIAFLLALVLSVICGNRFGGFDYNDYQDMIDAIRANAEEDWVVILNLAKDPGFALVTYVASWFSDTYFSVFFPMAVLGFIPKAIVAFMLPKYKTLFVALYALFLAPGLEFAAIRSAVGIGFLGLAILSTFAVRYRVALFLTAGAFHVSMFAGVLLLFRRFWRFASNNFWFAPLIAILIALAGVGLIKELFESRGMDPGTIYAPFFPVITLVALFFFSRQRFVFANTLESDRYRASIAAATFFASLAMAMAIPVAVAAGRLLEVSQFFGLFSIVMAASRNRLNALAVISVSMMVLIIVFINISRILWTVMAQTSLG